MPRKIKAWVDKRSRRWYVRLGEIDPKTGKRRPIMLRDPDGNPIAEKDEEGKTKALARLLEDRDVARKRRTGPSVDDLIVWYIRWHELMGSAKRTIEHHEYRLVRFSDFVSNGVRYGDRAASDISVRDLKRIRQAMEESGNGAGYIAGLYASVKACWAWAARPIEEREPIEPLITVDPFHKLPVPKRGQGDEKFVPIPLQDRLIRFAEQRHPTVHPNGRQKDGLMLLAFKLVALSGCRPTEAIELRWDEIDWDAGLIKIPARHHATGRKVGKEESRRVHKTGKKTGKIRRIDVRPNLMSQLRELHEHPDRHPTWVFIVPGRSESPNARRFGQWFSQLRAAAKGTAAALHETCTLYWFRHTFQSIGRRVATDEEVADVAGNTPELVRTTYGHGEDTHVKSVADRIASYRETLADTTPGKVSSDPAPAAPEP